MALESNFEYYCIVVLDLQTGFKTVNNTKCVYSPMKDLTTFRTICVILVTEKLIFAAANAPNNVVMKDLFVFDRNDISLQRVVTLAPDFFFNSIILETSPVWKYKIIINRFEFITQIEMDDNLNMDFSNFNIPNRFI